MGQLTDQLGTRVYLDTNIIIYALEGYETYAAPIKSLLQALTEGAIVGVTSELTVAEVLVKPKRDGNAKLEEAYRRFLLPTASLRNSAVSREILEVAAGIRATSTLKLPDAIHWATATIEHCDSFLTNDEGFKSVAGVRVVMLSDLLPAE
ncbi:MAG TPA: type II toxin-antitoxin system VapC family toxin [Blastocatellia bacterium]|nr:type II toxin-antitoxin system VapC family toxin [Blastocatellia bacterium]